MRYRFSITVFGVLLFLGTAVLAAFAHHNDPWPFYVKLGGGWQLAVYHRWESDIHAAIFNPAEVIGVPQAAYDQTGGELVINPLDFPSVAILDFSLWWAVVCSLLLPVIPLVIYRSRGKSRGFPVGT